MKQTRQNNLPLAEEIYIVKETSEVSNHNNLKGARKCNYIGRSKNIRDGTGNSCVPKEIVMKNRVVLRAAPKSKRTTVQKGFYSQKRDY